MWFVGWVIISCGFMVIKYNKEQEYILTMDRACT